MASLRRSRMRELWMTAKLGSGLADGSMQRARRFLLSDASALMYYLLWHKLMV